MHGAGAGAVLRRRPAVLGLLGVAGVTPLAHRVLGGHIRGVCSKHAKAAGSASEACVRDMCTQGYAQGLRWRRGHGCCGAQRLPLLPLFQPCAVLMPNIHAVCANIVTSMLLLLGIVFRAFRLLGGGAFRTQLDVQVQGGPVFRPFFVLSFAAVFGFALCLALYTWRIRARACACTR